MGAGEGVELDLLIGADGNWGEGLEGTVELLDGGTLAFAVTNGVGFAPGKGGVGWLVPEKEGGGMGD